LRDTEVRRANEITSIAAGEIETSAACWQMSDQRWRWNYMLVAQSILDVPSGSNKLEISRLPRCDLHNNSRIAQTAVDCTPS